MILTFAEEFSSTVQLDAELIGTPESGLFWNRGVHPLLTVDNLLSILPYTEFTFSAWDNGSTYNKFETSKKRSDVVSYNDKIYLSLLGSNSNQEPGVATTYWLETNIESLRIRSFIWTVDDNFSNALNLTRKLIENQYLYNVGEENVDLSNDYSGWVFEPKGSDYISIRINQMALQSVAGGDIDIYVINQGVLVDTISLTSANGISFQDVDYIISGKGRFLFVFESQEVISENPFNDPLRYDSFVCYPVNGIGASPQAAEYSEGSIGNGMSFNVSTFSDSSVYVDNNKIDFAKFLKSQMELDFIRMALHNANSQSNRKERVITMDKQLLATEVMSLDMNTIARSYNREKDQAIESINRTFDKFLHKKKGFRTKRKTI